MVHCTMLQYSVLCYNTVDYGTVQCTMVRGCPYIALSVIMEGGSGKRLCQYNMWGVGGIINYKENTNIKIV